MNGKPDILGTRVEMKKIWLISTSHSIDMMGLYLISWEPHLRRRNPRSSDRTFAPSSFETATGLRLVSLKYPLVMTSIAIENHHAINGKFHYFYAMFNSYISHY